MFAQLLKSLFAKAPPAAVSRPRAAPLPDTRLAALQAQRAEYEARYAELTRQLQADGDSLDLLLDLGHLCYQLDRDAECEDLLKRALAIDPNQPVALCGLGMVVFTHGRMDESEHYLRRALAVAPTERSILYSLAMTLMGRGNYPEGYRYFSSRLAGPSRLGGKIEPLPAWRGEPLTGKSLVLWSDWGGFGDDLAYVRYARVIRERYQPARLIAAVPRPLVRLFAGQPYLDQAVVITDGASADLQCPFIEAVSLTGTTVDTVPSWPAYLEVPESEVRVWRATMRDEKRLKVGLAWSGGAGEPGPGLTTTRLDKHLPASALLPLAGLAGLCFVSLQKGDHAGRAADLLPGAALIDDTDALGDFADTAALIAALDMVVAVDTAVAHLAGALGRPTLLLLKRSGGYFWPGERSDTPWYPNMRIVRQHAHGDWSEAIARVRAVLERRTAGVPWPECFDGA
jgi:hypothetical protein